MNRERLVELLSEEDLPLSARQEIVLAAAGSNTVQQLVQLVEAGADQGGWASIHAANLLGELKAGEAIEPLLEVLGDLEDDAALFDGITSALLAMGADVLEPVLAYYPRCCSADAQGACLEILVQCAGHDERIWLLLLEFLDEEPEYAAGLMAMYGDRRACAVLTRELDALDMPADDPDLVAETVAEFGVAIERLGGTLTPTQQAKVMAARQYAASPESSAAERAWKDGP